MHPSAPVRRSGRPTDQHLTQRLLTSTVQLLAEHGLPLSTGIVAAHARAGKAAVYRRWPDMPALVNDALHTCSVVPATPDTGCARDDLAVLLSPLDQALTVQERAVAAAAGWTMFDRSLAATISAVVRAPLHNALAMIVAAHRRRGARVPAGGEQRLVHLVHALWWHHVIGAGAAGEQPSVPTLVDDVLLPQLQPRPVVPSAPTVR